MKIFIHLLVCICAECATQQFIYAPIAPGQTSGQQPDISWAYSVVWAPTLDWPLVFFSIEQEFSGLRCSKFFDYFVRNVNYVLLCRQEQSWRDERHSKIAIADLGGHNLHLVSTVSSFEYYVNWLLIIYPASRDLSARTVLIIIQSSVSGLSLLIKENRAASRVTYLSKKFIPVQLTCMEFAASAQLAVAIKW